MVLDDLDLAGKLNPTERTRQNYDLNNISPDDAKYAKESRKLQQYLSAAGEWKGYARVQRVLLETRVEFGQAEPRHLAELDAAILRMDPLNVALLEGHPDINHDILALLEELGRYVSPETKSLLHPGTTSYDIIDTTRAYLFQGAWEDVIRPVIVEGIDKLLDMSDEYLTEDEIALENEERMPYLQVGRTHLQKTSPVPFGVTIAGYGLRLARRLELCDQYFDNLKGTISGIVGSGGSIDVVIGEGKSWKFEEVVLRKLGLEPDTTATQVVQKEALADVGHGLTTLTAVLRDFARDIRRLYSSDIGEVTSLDAAKRLGGSSADAGKNNPIQWENMAGKAVIVKSGMDVLYELITTDFQRDLESSVQARYQPQGMMVQTFESFSRFHKALDKLYVITDKMAENLQPVRDKPTEAMVAILRGANWVHPEHGVGHDFVKAMAKKKGRKLLEVCLEDPHFKTLYDSLETKKQKILQGNLELYAAPALQRARENIEEARELIG